LAITEPYYEKIRYEKDPVRVRKRLIEILKENKFNISKTASEVGTTPKTVRKWWKRYEEEGTKGLVNRSKRPLNSPNRTKEEVKELVISLRKPNDKLNARIGPKKIHFELAKRYGERLSVSTIYRILRDAGLIKPRRKKWQKKRELALYRRKAKPLRYWQVDTKHLRDIIEIYPLINRGIIPRYQYTVRDVLTGRTFIFYAEELSVINSMRFIFLLLTWLKRHGIPLEEVEITTDNGSEFIGSVYKKRDPGFSLVVTSFGS